MASAAGISNSIKQLSGSVSIALLTVILTGRTAFHSAQGGLSSAESYVAGISDDFLFVTSFRWPRHCPSCGCCARAARRLRLRAKERAPDGFAFIALNPYFCPGGNRLFPEDFEKRSAGHYVPDPEVASRLLEWYGREGRDLPWRRTRDPYRIWISEVILQQTRVAQGMSYYHRFLELFPDVAALASAPEDLVLKCWQGLGYYSRARNLLAAARRIVETHGGVFPTDYADVRALPGVGDYTAAAICSIAYDEPCAALDGNVFRVLSRLYDLDTPIDTTSGRRTFAALADSLIDRQRPGLYNQAIMDFGALCCLPAQPRCTECPLRDRCLAFAARTVDVRPVKQGRTAVEPRYFNYLHVECGDELVLRRRGAGDIWQGLYEFPLIENSRTCGIYGVGRDAGVLRSLQKMPGRYALPGPSRCPCISFRTGRSTLFSTGSSWSAGRPPCAKCSLFRVKILGDYAVFPSYGALFIPLILRLCVCGTRFAV